MVKIVCKTLGVWGKVWKPGDVSVVPPDNRFPKSIFQFNHPKHPDGPADTPLPIRQGCINLLGDGPSLKDVVSDPSLVKGPVAAVNRAGVKWPGRLDFWLTLHPQFMALWRKQRRDAGHQLANINYVVSRVIYNPEVIVFPDPGCGGSSTLYAVDALTAMGFEHIHMTGVDLSGGYEVFRPSWHRDFTALITGRSFS